MTIQPWLLQAFMEEEVKEKTKKIFEVELDFVSFEDDKLVSDSIKFLESMKVDK